MGLSEAELSVLVTDDAELRELNKNYRGIDRATDVLSFPQEGALVLGDVAISIEQAERQAASYGAGIGEEMARLLVHGILHLLGYDHVNGGRQAAKMKRREAELMEALAEDGLIRAV